MVYPEGFVITKMLSNESGVCVFQAEVGYYNIKYTIAEDNQNRKYQDSYSERVVLATGTAYEKESSSFINKTSYIENCETSAVGRALGMCGFGIDVSVASAEEVENAILQQDADKKISKTQVDALYNLIKNKGVENDEVIATLKQNGYEKLADIKVKDYMSIAKYFENFVRE